MKSLNAAVMALMIQGFLLVTTVQSQTPSDGSVDLSKYKTYRWIPSDPDPTATAQRRSNHAKIRSAIEEILNNKGFLYQKEGPVDLLVDFLVWDGPRRKSLLSLMTPVPTELFGW